MLGLVKAVEMMGAVRTVRVVGVGVVGPVRHVRTLSHK